MSNQYVLELNGRQCTNILDRLELITFRKLLYHNRALKTTDGIPYTGFFMRQIEGFARKGCVMAKLEMLKIKIKTQ